MSVSEQARHELFNWCEEVMGPERAATLMSLLPPVGWADVATKQDLIALEGHVDRRFEVVDQRFDAVDQRFDAVDRRLGGIEAETRASQRAFVTWLLASQAAVLTVVVGAAGAVVALV